MSILEKKLINKVYLDDTTTLSASIINAEAVQGHTEYVIRVQRGLLPENSWNVHRRYNNFLSLNHEFQSDGVVLPFPPKKILGNMDREFIAERRAGLQKYLDIILKDPLISSQLVVKKFLDPHNYSSYSALGHIQMCIKLSGESNIKIVKQLPHLGWRLRKEHYLVNFDLDNTNEYILTWSPFGPDKYLDDKQKFLSILKSLENLQHINIVPITKVGICQDGGWVVKQVKKCGSLLDTMYAVKSAHTTSVLRKYKSVEPRNFLATPKVVSNIASQILQTLAFLHHKGFYYGHLHLGNIVLDDGIVKLLDVENSLFGLPSYYRESFVKVRQIQSMQAIDVYSFGLVIYEMLFGKPFNDCHKNEIAQCPQVFKSVLESILCPPSKAALPTIADLLNNQLFLQVQPAAPEPVFNLKDNPKKLLESNAAKLLVRLKEDQTKYRQVVKKNKMFGMFHNEGKLVVCIKDKSKVAMKEESEINGNIDLSNRSESVSSKDSSKNSGCSEEKLPPIPPAPLINEEKLPPPPSAPLIKVDDRSALWGAICNFNKSNLKKVNSNN